MKIEEWNTNMQEIKWTRVGCNVRFTIRSVLLCFMNRNFFLSSLDIELED